MNKLVAILIFSLCNGVLFAQVYTHPIAGLQNSNLGTCMVNTCSGTYYDDGGAGSDYSLNINGVYRTFCPSIANTCIQATFTQFDVNDYDAFWCGGCCDIFQVINGATQNNPALFYGCGAGALGPFTSTDSSGCLGFRFWSDGIFTYPGWTITLSCVPCGVGPTGTTNNDCIQNTPVCNSLPIPNTNTGPGLISTCTDCIVSENYSSWYHVIIQAGGTFEMSIVADNGTDDYDFAIFQSNSCATLGVPVRCTYAAEGIAADLAPGTGFTAGNTGTTEDVTGDSWLAPITGTVAGDEFFIMINDWSGTAGGYTINWGGTASLDCVVLPVELLDFVGRPYDNYIELNWNVAAELSLERYDIEKLINGEWTKILETQPVGNNSFYAITDINPIRGANIYRLKSIDFNGEFSYSDAISVNYNKSIFDVIISSEKITINSTDIDIESIELFNVLGQEINNLPLTILNEGEKYIIDLDQLSNNTYIIRINGIESRLFIKY